MVVDGLAYTRQWRSLIDGHKEVVRQWREELKQLGQVTAQYYRAKALAEIRYRNSGYPAGMCQDLAKGDTTVVPLLEKKTELEGLVKADNEVIQTNKRQLDMTRDQYKRDWGEQKN